MSFNEPELTEIAADLAKRTESERKRRGEVKSIGAVLNGLKVSPQLMTADPVGDAELAALEADRFTSEQRQRDQGHWGSYISDRGKRYADCTLGNYSADTYQQQQMLDEVGAYVMKLSENLFVGHGLTLFGSVGTGKDHIAAAVCRAAIFGCHRCVQWVDGMTLFGELRSAFDATSKTTERDVLARYAKADVLAISDPLPVSGVLTDFQASALFRIIDGRYNQMRPTIVTVNVKDAADASARLGVPIADRLRHSSLALNFAWPSYRRPTPPA